MIAEMRRAPHMVPKDLAGPPWRQESRAPSRSGVGRNPSVCLEKNCGREGRSERERSAARKLPKEEASAPDLGHAYSSIFQETVLILQP